jgi:hypothetical protein
VFSSVLPRNVFDLTEVEQPFDDSVMGAGHEKVGQPDDLGIIVPSPLQTAKSKIEICRSGPHIERMRVSDVCSPPSAEWLTVPKPSKLASC